MIDPILFSIARALFSPLSKLLSFIFGKVKRPSVSDKSAPKNLFEHIKPEVSVARVKELLGTPHHEETGQYRYVFKEACVQINFTDMTVDSVSVALRKVSSFNHFHIWPINELVLGKTTFASIIEMNSKVIFDWSSKFYHFYIINYYGFPGLYWNYALGYLACPSVYPDNYHWSPETQTIDEIPKQMKVNWVCVTRLQEPPPFSYYGFL